MNIERDLVWMSVNDVQNIGELVQRMHLCRYHRLLYAIVYFPPHLISTPQITNYVHA